MAKGAPAGEWDVPVRGDRTGKPNEIWVQKREGKGRHRGGRKGLEGRGKGRA